MHILYIPFLGTRSTLSLFQGLQINGLFTPQIRGTNRQKAIGSWGHGYHGLPTPSLPRLADQWPGVSPDVLEPALDYL